MKRSKAIKNIVMMIMLMIGGPALLHIIQSKTPLGAIIPNFIPIHNIIINYYSHLIHSPRMTQLAKMILILLTIIILRLFQIIILFCHSINLIHHKYIFFRFQIGLHQCFLQLNKQLAQFLL